MGPGLQNDQPALSRQLFQERLRVLQIYRVETLGEPVVDLREHLSRFVVLPVFAKETTETRRGSKLERLGALLAGNLDGLPKARLGFGVRSEGLVNADESSARNVRQSTIMIHVLRTTIRGFSQSKFHYWGLGSAPCVRSHLFRSSASTDLKPV